MKHPELSTAARDVRSCGSSICLVIGGCMSVTFLLHTL